MLPGVFLGQKGTGRLQITSLKSFGEKCHSVHVRQNRHNYLQAPEIFYQYDNLVSMEQKRSLQVHHLLQPIHLQHQQLKRRQSLQMVLAQMGSSHRRPCARNVGMQYPGKVRFLCRKVKLTVS